MLSIIEQKLFMAAEQTKQRKKERKAVQADLHSESWFLLLWIIPARQRDWLLVVVVRSTSDDQSSRPQIA